MTSGEHLEHLKLLGRGGSEWSAWRSQNPTIRPDLRGVRLARRNLVGASLWDTDLRGADLSDAKLVGADLTGADLREARLIGADLSSAKLYGADLRGADLLGATLFEADLRSAELEGAKLIRAQFLGASLVNAKLMKANCELANFSYANLTGVDFTGASLHRSVLLHTNLQSARLVDCSVYGVSVWDVNLEGAHQSSLQITRGGEFAVTVDDLEVAQFVYIMLRNAKIRKIIETISSKIVLILGRFSTPRKAVLDAVREELRRYDCVPVIFDFDQPNTRDTHETITLLARLAQFIVADITDARSIPQELVSVVEQLPSIPVQLLLQEGSEPWGMIDHILRYPWVLDVIRYRDVDELCATTLGAIVEAARRQVEHAKTRRVP